MNKLSAILITLFALIVATPATAAEKPLIKILFIGTSYPFYNDMPYMLEQLINDSKQSPIRANIKSVTKGGASIETHWKDGLASRAITDGTQWHYVVLQNQSNWAMYPLDTKSGYIYGRKFADQIAKIGAVPVIFATWPKELNSAHYNNNQYLKNFGHSYKSLNYHAKELARRIDAQVVPVNDYWVKTLQDYANITLYDNDGSHPAPAGTYLAALAFYKFFTGAPLKTQDTKIKGINAKTAATLRYAVAYPSKSHAP